MIDYNFVALPKIYRFLSGNELKVFVTIFDQWSQMKNEDGWYYRSQKQLCEDTGLTDRTLRDIIKKFVEKGVIFTTTYNDGVKMATYNKANEYKINMEKVVEMSEKKGVKSVKEGGKNDAPYKNKENKNNISKDFSTYGNSTCRENDENKKFKENEMSDNGTSVMNKKRNEIEDNFKEAIISKAIGNINLDKSSMFYAKSQMEYDVALEDLKVNLKKLQDNTSTEAYNNFRAQLGKWFNASKPYMKFAQSKKKKVNTAPAPTDEEMGKLEWFVEGVKVSKSIEETDKYFKKIDQMFEILYRKYPQNTVDKLYERTTDRLSEYKKNNPIVAEYIKNVTGEPQTIEVEQLLTVNCI